MLLTNEMHQAALGALETLVESVFPEFRDPLASLSASEPKLQLQQSAELLADLRSIRVFWKFHQDLLFGGCNSLVAKDGGLEHHLDIEGLQDYDMPWRLQAMKYRSDDLGVFFSGNARLNILEHQANADGFIYLRTSKVPIWCAGNTIGVMGAFEMLKGSDSSTAGSTNA